MNIDRIIKYIRDTKLSEEMMTTGSAAGKPGFSGSADAEGPVAGYDKPLGKKKKEPTKPTILARGKFPGLRKLWGTGIV